MKLSIDFIVLTMRTSQDTGFRLADCPLHSNASLNAAKAESMIVIR